jgi:hypothetical protein
VATSTIAYTLSATSAGPYVEVIDDPFGPVFLDRQGYGHRTSAYEARWNTLGREHSGWDQMADGSFVSQAPIGKRGHPIDPSLPDVLDAAGTPHLVVLGLAAAGALCLWLAFRK